MKTLFETLAKKTIKQTEEWLSYTDIPDIDLLIDLIDSEFEELIYAIRTDDLVEEFDAIIDIIYLSLQLYGHPSQSGDSARDVENALLSLIRFNNTGEFSYSEEELLAGLKAVHKSNMSKLCKTEDEAIETVKRYSAGRVVFTYEKVKDVYIVRDDKWKVRKPINYESPTDDLVKILEERLFDE